MIIKLLMELLKALIMLVISLFPTMPAVSWLSDFVANFAKMMQSIGIFISLPTVSLCFVLIMLCYNARAIWSLVMWVIRKIPGVS